MSLLLSETAVAKNIRVACLFLAKFDNRLGYTMVWCHNPHELPLAGLENKALPSGIHEYEATSVYLAHPANESLYYGVARFRQHNSNTDGGADRSKIKMYSLGLLVEPSLDLWQPNAAADMGWQLLPALDAALAAFLPDENLSEIVKLHSLLEHRDNLIDEGLDLPTALLPPPVPTDHPLFRLPALLGNVGPLIFPLYKAALLRKRIMVFHHSSQGGELLTRPNARDPASCGALAYLVSLISLVPRDIKLPAGAVEPFSRPLYLLGLADMLTGIFFAYPGFLASTSDEILKDQRDLYDLALVMPPTDGTWCQLQTAPAPGPKGAGLRRVKATFNDYSKFTRLYAKLTPTPPDDASIQTLSLLLSAWRLGAFDGKLAHEPVWWLADATLPMSWREYIWLAFAWFASAGTTSRKATANLATGDAVAGDDAEADRLALVQSAALVGLFHKLTKKWFVIIDDIVLECAEPGEKITLALTPQDLVDMELDPYLREDVAFVKEFVLAYWASTVDDVEIGLGVHGFCC